MPRPDKPLVNRPDAVRAAIRIIDADGLAAFSLPRLATEFGVRVPSLYHHFKDRDDILFAVVQYVAGTAVAVSGQLPGPGWPRHFALLARNFRRSFLEHRNTAPLLMRYRPRDLLPGGYEAAAKFLAESEVPVELHIRILDGMETLLIGTVLCEVMNPFLQSGSGFAKMEARSHPKLAAAAEACPMDAASLCERKVLAFLNGVSHRISRTS